MKLLFIHGHLIVDENTEFLDGAIYIEDDRILKVYPQSNKIKDNFEDTEIIDLKNNILMPAFFDCHYTKNQKGVGYYLRNTEYYEAYEDDDRCLGYFLDDPEYLIELTNKYNNIKGACVALELNHHEEFIKENKDIKILLGHSEIKYKDININYDGIRSIFIYTEELDSKEPTLANSAFIDDKYVEFDTNIDKSMLKIILNNISSRKLILSSSNLYESVLKLKELNVKNTDILAYTSLNALRLYELDNNYGSLRKGKYACFNVVDNNYRILFSYIKGELIK